MWYFLKSSGYAHSLKTERQKGSDRGKMNNNKQFISSSTHYALICFRWNEHWPEIWFHTWTDLNGLLFPEPVNSLINFLLWLFLFCFAHYQTPRWTRNEKTLIMLIFLYKTRSHMRKTLYNLGSDPAFVKALGYIPITSIATAPFSSSIAYWYKIYPLLVSTLPQRVENQVYNISYVKWSSSLMMLILTYKCNRFYWDGKITRLDFHYGDRHVINMSFHLGEPAVFEGLSYRKLN